MEQLSAIFSIILIASFCIAILMLIRNELVFNFRMNAIHRNNGDYEKLPSYNDMVNKFWILDLNKFIRKD